MRTFLLLIAVILVATISSALGAYVVSSACGLLFAILVVRIIGKSILRS